MSELLASGWFTLFALCCQTPRVALLRLCQDLVNASTTILALRIFLQFGVDWAGHHDDISFLVARAVRILFYSFVDQMNVRNRTAGLKKSRPALTDQLYQKSSVSAMLKRLLVLGLLARERADRNGSRSKEFASIAIVAVLVDVALQWQKYSQKLKKDGKRAEHARPAKTTLTIPLKSTSPSGNLSLATAAEDQCSITGLVCVQKIETTSVFTPPCRSPALRPLCIHNGLRAVVVLRFP